MQLPLQIEVFVKQPLLLHGPADHVSELVRSERLGQIIRRAQLDCGDRGLDGRVAGDHDHDSAGTGLLDVFEQRHAVHSRQLDVAQHQVDRVALEPGLSGLGAGRNLDRVADPLQRLLDRFDDVALVVNR